MSCSPEDGGDIGRSAIVDDFIAGCAASQFCKEGSRHFLAVHRLIHSTLASGDYLC